MRHTSINVDKAASSNLRYKTPCYLQGIPTGWYIWAAIGSLIRSIRVSRYVVLKYRHFKSDMGPFFDNAASNWPNTCIIIQHGRVFRSRCRSHLVNPRKRWPSPFWPLGQNSVPSKAVRRVKPTLPNVSLLFSVYLLDIFCPLSQNDIWTLSNCF